MSKIQNNKKLIEDQLGELSSAIVLAAEKIKEAESKGDKERVFLLREQGLILSDEAERLQSQYSSLEEEEAQPELERIGALTQELARPYAAPAPNYMGMGGLVTTSSPQKARDTPVSETKEADTQRKREIVSELGYAPPISEEARESEMLPASLLAQLGSLPTPEGKAQLLEQTYGKGNIMPIDVGGQTEFVIKQPDGSTKTTLDRGIAGTLGAAAVEVPLTIAEIGAGLGTLSSTRSPVLAATAAAGTRGALGTGIDEALRFTYGMDSDFGGSAARRGTEAVLGLGLDAASAGIAGTFASRIPDPFENTFVKTLESARNNLMTAEEKLAARQGRPAGMIQVPSGARLAGQEGIEVQSGLAGDFPSSSIASSARSTQETIVRLFDDVKSNVPAAPSDFADIAAQKEAQKAALSQQIAGATGRSKAIIESTLDRQTKGPASNIDELGDILRSSIKNAEDQTIKNVSRDYEEIFPLADQAGFSITPEQMLDVVASMRRDVNVSGAAETSAVKSVTDRLRRRRDAPQTLARAKEKLQEITSDGRKPPQDLLLKIKDLESLAVPMNSRDFDSFIKAFREARPENMASGATEDVFGRKIANKLSEYRKGVYDSLDTTLPDGTPVNIGSLFESASQEVALRQGYEKNLLGNVLKELGGEQSRTPRDIVNAVLKEPATVNRVVKSLRELGASDPSKAGEADRILGLLQVQYMNDIGIQPIVRGSSRVREVKPDEGMLNALFGQNAPAIARSLQDMNVSMRQIGKIDSTMLAPEDIRRMSLPLPDEERKALVKTIAKRIQLEKESEAVVNNQIFKLAKKGNFKNIDSDSLSKTILSPSSSISDVAVTMRELNRMSPKSRNLYKGDFMRELLNQYPGGTPTVNAPFEKLFDTRRFAADYESPLGVAKSEFAKKLQTVLGKERADFLYDLAITYNANEIGNAAKAGMAPRAIASEKGNFTVILPLERMARDARNRYIAAMLSTGTKFQGVKKALAKNALPGDINKAYNEMFKELFLTNAGVTALAQQASTDPEFSAELSNMVKDFNLNQGQVPEN